MTISRFRLSTLAEGDLVSILRTSERMHGTAARVRYRGLLAATFRRAAREPTGPLPKDRSEFLDGLRSLHTKHCRHESQEAPVADPVHVVFYRLAEPDAIEIVRVLHQRMMPAQHLDMPP